MQMVALSTTNIRWSESYCFYPLLTLIFGMSTFCSNYSSTCLWHRVNIFPDNFNTNVIPCLLQLKPKTFLWMYNRSVQFILQLPPNLLHGIEVHTLRGPVHHFQCSNTFLPSQVVPGIIIVLFYGYCNGQFNKNNWNLLNMPSVLTILATTVHTHTIN